MRTIYDMRTTRADRAVWALAALALVACGGGAEAMGKEAESYLELGKQSATFVSLADPVLREAFEDAQTRCLAQCLVLPDPSSERSQCMAEPGRDQCIESTRAKWAPVIESLRGIRATWCSLEPQKCGP